VRGGRPAQLDTSHAFTKHEWKLVRVVADGLGWSYGWREPAAQRLRFMLDFAYATVLRISELVGAKLGAIDSDAHGDTSREPRGAELIGAPEPRLKFRTLT
jgi:integrase